MRETERLALKLVREMEVVFSDDWTHSIECIGDPLFYGEGGTFLEPNVEDVGANWTNRKPLLEAYEALRKHMQELQDERVAMGFSLRRPTH